jgi:hypothetical protein
MRASAKDYWLLAGGLLPAILVVALAYAVVPVFAAMYSKVPSSWPQQTVLLFAGYRWLVVLPLAVVAVWFGGPQSNRRALAALMFGVASSCIVLAFGWWATHQPEVILAAIRAAGNHGP